MVLFLDIDGTLSKGKNYVSNKVIYAIREVRKNGHYVILCTGRNRMDIEGLMYIGFDGAICSGGGFIEIDGKEIFHSTNKQEDIDFAIKLMEENEIHYKLESDYLSFQNDEMIMMFNRFSDDLVHFKKSHHIFPLSDYNSERIQTVYFFGKPEGMDILEEKLSDLFTFYRYGSLPNGYLEGEIMNREVSKGVGIHKVMEYYQLPIEDTIGFGDSMNDLALIQTVKIGVVMGNGSDKLKQYATSICESVEDDGIYHELLRRKLIGEYHEI